MMNYDSITSPHSAEVSKFITLWQGFPPELQRTLLEQLGSENSEKDTLEELKDIDPDLHRAVEEYLVEIRSNKRVQHPTKLEKVLLKLDKNPHSLITLEQLLELTGTPKESDAVIRNIITKIRKHLDKKGFSNLLPHVSAFSLLNNQPKN